METWQREHLQSSLAELTQFTTCTPTFLEELKSRNVLTSQEVKALNHISNKSSQSRKFYEILQTRIEHYDIVKTILQEAGQTAAFTIFDKCNETGIVTLGRISYCKNIPLGIGTSSLNSKAYLGKFGTRAGNVAVTKLFLDDTLLEKALEKIGKLKRLERHPNILKCYGHEATDGFILIATELCSISLKEWAAKNCESGKSSQQVLQLLRQATEGIEHLHSNGVTLGCLGPENILISNPDENSSRVKISAFGASTLVEKVGGWSAPEVIIRNGKGSMETNSKADIFSLGCIFYFVLTHGRHPFGDEDYRLMANIVDGELSLIESDITAVAPSLATSFLWLIRHMLSHNENERPSASTILAHPVFWSDEKAFQFFKDTSQYIDKHAETLDISAGLVAGEVMDQGWLAKVCPVVRKYLEEKNDELDDKKFSTLVKVMMEFELSNLPEDVKDAMAGDKTENDVDVNGPSFIQYWLSRFPFLLPIVWTVFQKLMTEEKWIARQYFQIESGFEFCLVGMLENVVITFPVLKSDVFLKESVTRRLQRVKPVQKVKPLKTRKIAEGDKPERSEQMQAEESVGPITVIRDDKVTTGESQDIEEQDTPNISNCADEKVPVSAGTNINDEDDKAPIPVPIPTSRRDIVAKDDTMELNGDHDQPVESAYI